MRENKNDSDPKAESANSKFSILRIYLKDVSFETPNSPQVFKADYTPEIQMELNSRANQIEDSIYEVILSITVTSKIGDKTAYLAEVQQAGLFHMEGYSSEHFQSMIAAYCPHNLYPYAREAISDLVVKGGFPPMLLAPMNFEQLRQDNVRKVQNKETG